MRIDFVTPAPILADVYRIEGGDGVINFEIQVQRPIQVDVSKTGLPPLADRTSL